jgi:hypothetical protein
MQQFICYVGIDYSGAQTPDASLKGLRVYRAERDGQPFEVLPMLLIPGPIRLLELNFFVTSNVGTVKNAAVGPCRERGCCDAERTRHATSAFGEDVRRRASRHRPWRDRPKFAVGRRTFDTLAPAISPRFLQHTS